MSEIKVYKAIMDRNARQAAVNNATIGKALGINMMSSPGAGKTTLLEKTLQAFKGKMKIGIIEGDIATSNDAKRVAKFASKGSVYQIKTENYGGGCHLDAAMVNTGLKKIKARTKKYDAIIFENVGNLICPADFSLGEDIKVVMLSVTEGDDKPLKYPGMFEAADLVILSKIDLLKHTNFSLENAIKNISVLNPNCAVIGLSATGNKGLKEWLQFLKNLVVLKKRSSR